MCFDIINYYTSLTILLIIRGDKFFQYRIILKIISQQFISIFQKIFSYVDAAINL